MTYQRNDHSRHPVVELLVEKGFDEIAEGLTLLFNEVMQIEREHHLRAKPYERTSERTDYANGYKNKTVQTRLGKLKLNVPQTRESDFYPSSLERGLRSERALTTTIAQMYVSGVATRKVKNAMQALCGFGVSSSAVSRAAKGLDDCISAWRTRALGKYRYLFLDARYEAVRQSGCVRDSAVLIAYGIDESGKRRILGVSVALSEAEVHWRAFLESLTARGLHGIELIISDAHSGLKAARKAVLPSVPWQRCQFHLQQNAQSYVPKRSMRTEVARDIRRIFNATDLAEANGALARTICKYETSAPQLAQWMVQAVPESLTVMSFPEANRKRLRTSNLAERVNKEIVKRTRVVGIFPDEAACLRLVTAVVMEIDEEWQKSMRYLSLEKVLE